MDAHLVEVCECKSLTAILCDVMDRGEMNYYPLRFM
jgi:hypothetical protein